jgi:hypothetical protein
MHLTDEVNLDEIIGPSAGAEEASKHRHENITRSGSVKGYDVSSTVLYVEYIDNVERLEIVVQGLFVLAY